MGSSGRNGSSSDAPAMLNMLPKLALVAMNTYLSVLASVLRPSMMPRCKTARLCSSRMKPAACRATSTAVSTEMPTSAVCSAGASFTPSPM